MLLKFFLIFISFIYHNFVFGFPIKNKNNNIFIQNQNDLSIYFNYNDKKKLLFLKKNECFSFSKLTKNFYLQKNQITIFNRNFIGFFQKNRFKIFYIVKAHDTLYSIAKNSGYNYYELSKFNFIKKPYKIIIGQKIWMGDVFINENKKNCSVIHFNKKYSMSCEEIFNYPLKIEKFLKDTTQYSTSKICFFCDDKNKKNNIIFKENYLSFSKDWHWPIKSPHIQYIYHSKSKNKQIEFFGFKGQPVFAAATGKVVYITDIFKKYGRLIILKHNKNYLSIYAFNNLILVKQKDRVHVNQQISTMGVSDKNTAQLYFEVRYKGQSINPLNILPKINTKKVNY